MTVGRGEYFRALSEGDALDWQYVDYLLEEMRWRVTPREVPPELLRSRR